MSWAEPQEPKPSPEQVEEALEYTRRFAAARRKAPTLADAIAMFGEDAVLWSSDNQNWSTERTAESRYWRIPLCSVRKDELHNRRRWQMWTELSRPMRRDVIEASAQRDATRPKVRAINMKTGEVRDLPAEAEDRAARPGSPWRPHTGIGRLVDQFGKAFA